MFTILAFGKSSERPQPLNNLLFFSFEQIAVLLANPLYYRLKSGTNAVYLIYFAPTARISDSNSTFRISFAITKSSYGSGTTVANSLWVLLSR